MLPGKKVAITTTAEETEAVRKQPRRHDKLTYRTKDRTLWKPLVHSPKDVPWLFHLQSTRVQGCVSLLFLFNLRKCA